MDFRRNFDNYLDLSRDSVNLERLNVGAKYFRLLCSSATVLTHSEAAFAVKNMPADMSAAWQVFFRKFRGNLKWERKTAAKREVVIG